MDTCVSRLFAAAVVMSGLSVCVPSAAKAQGGPPEHIRGTITAAEAAVLTVKTRDGAMVKISLPEKIRVSGYAKADFAEIKKGAYIGTAAAPSSDGTLRAQEVLIFPANMRGVGEGHRPWDLTPDSTMTNANVDLVVESVKGRTMTLKYKGGEKQVLVPPETPIVTIVKADKSMLKPGAHIFALARKGAGGEYVPIRIGLGINGLVPPM